MALPPNTLVPHPTKSSLALAVGLTLILVSTWVFSLRPLRLKIGYYYYSRGDMDRAVAWYGKVVRKNTFMLNHDGSYYLSRKEDLTKLNSAFLFSSEKNIFKIISLLGYEEIIDPRTHILNPNFLQMDINQKSDKETKQRFAKAKEDLVNFANTTSYYKHLFKMGPIRSKLDYLIMVGEFLTAIVNEAESHFIFADTIYEQLAISHPEISNSMGRRRDRILPMVVNEFFCLYPTFKKVNNANVLLETESPLIITGISPGLGNYLEYKNQPLRIVYQKYLMPQFKIQGEVLGKIKTSCISPRVVFWGEKGYLGEIMSKYPVNGKFDILFPFSIPHGTIDVTPRLTFDPSCFSQGQKILIEKFCWS